MSTSPLTIWRFFPAPGLLPTIPKKAPKRGWIRNMKRRKELLRSTSSILRPTKSMSFKRRSFTMVRTSRTLSSSSGIQGWTPIITPSTPQDTRRRKGLLGRLFLTITKIWLDIRERRGQHPLTTVRPSLIWRRFMSTLFLCLQRSIATPNPHHRFKASCIKISNCRANMSKLLNSGTTNLHRKLKSLICIAFHSLTINSMRMPLSLPDTKTRWGATRFNLLRMNLVKWCLKISQDQPTRWRFRLIILGLTLKIAIEMADSSMLKISLLQSQTLL